MHKTFLFSIWTIILSHSLFSQGQSLFLNSPVKWVNAGNINVTGSNVTIEALIHITNASGGNIVSKHTGPNNSNYLLRAQSFEITTSNGYANLVNPMILQTGVTYHVAATYNGSMMRFYVNGCLTAEQPWTGTLVTNSFATAIGQQSNCQCEQFTGYLDEVRIWNVARTEAQIRSNMYNIANTNIQFNLLAYFKFQNNFNNLALFSPATSTVGGPTLNALPYPYPSALAISHTGSNAICQNSNTGAIDMQASGGIQPYQFSLDGVNFQNSPVFNDLASGTYTIYVKSNDNCIATATRTIQNKPELLPNLNSSDVSCSGDTDGQASVAPSGGNGPAFSTTWSNGQTGNSVSNLAPGTYNVTVKDSCRVAGNELVVNGHFEQGPVGFTSQYISCAGCFVGIGEELLDNHFVVGISANHHHIAFNGTGQGGAGNFMIINGSSQPNTYVWCQTINVQPNTYYEFSAWVASLITQSPAQLQFQANGVLLGPIFSAPNAINTWNQFFSVWYSGANTSVDICIINQNTSIAGNDFAIDNISFKACLSCEKELEFTISEPDLLTATATAQNAVCGTNTGSISVETFGGTPNFSYSTDGITFLNNSTIQDLLPGVYTVIVQDNAGCEFSLDITVGDDDVIELTAGDDVSVCAGELVTLNASGSNGLVWSGGVQNGVPFTPNQSQYYTVEINLGPSCYAIDSLFVEVYPLPSVDAGESFTACSNEFIQLNASGALDYVWSNGISNNEPFNLNPGIYNFTVIGTDANGCSNSDQIDVEVFLSPNVSISANPNSGFAPLMVDFVNNDVQPFDYFWSFGNNSSQIINSQNTQYTFTNAGNYWVTVFAESNGCQDIDSILIIVESIAFDFEVPNVFSPNGDNENALFYLIDVIGGEQLKNFEVTIFNRWGEKIKTFDELAFAWDGKDNNGNELPEGVYFYKVNYTLKDESEGMKHGFVQLIR